MPTFDVSSIASSITAIALLPGVSEEEFEKFMEKEVFPSINLATRLFEVRQHVLLKSYQKIEGRSLYLWTIFASTTDVLQGQSHLVDELTRSETRADLMARISHHGAFITFADLNKSS